MNTTSPLLLMMNHLTTTARERLTVTPAPRQDEYTERRKYGNTEADPGNPLQRSFVPDTYRRANAPTGRGRLSAPLRRCSMSSRRSMWPKLTSPRPTHRRGRRPLVVGSSGPFLTARKDTRTNTHLFYAYPHRCIVSAHAHKRVWATSHIPPFSSAFRCFQGHDAYAHTYLRKALHI